MEIRFEQVPSELPGWQECERDMRAALADLLGADGPELIVLSFEKRGEAYRPQVVDAPGGGDLHVAIEAEAILAMAKNGIPTSAGGQ